MVFSFQLGRINGNLNFSRSIGDLAYKQNGKLITEEQLVVATPDLTKVEIKKGIYYFIEDDQFLVIGSDGVWETMETIEIVKFIK